MHTTTICMQNRNAAIEFESTSTFPLSDANLQTLRFYYQKKYKKTL